MNRDAIVAVVKENIKSTLDEVDVETLDLDRPLKEYDLNSLDVIEIISGSMRDLKIKVPREELGSVQTLNQLVDAFIRYTPA